MAIFGDYDGAAERRAHEIARDIVEKELASIDRMHSRAMLYIGSFTTVVVVLFGALGWIGYDRLQGIVLHYTLENVQKQTLDRVNSQVDKDLLSMDVPARVEEKVDAFAQSDLRSALTQEIEHGPVNDGIQRIARASAAATVRSRVTTPPSSSVTPTAHSPSIFLNDEQKRRFLDIAKVRNPPIWLSQAQTEDRNVDFTRSVELFILPDDEAALNYAKQLKDLLSLIGWNANVTPDPFVRVGAGGSLATGLHFFYNPRARFYNSYSRRTVEGVGSMLACLSLAGIPGRPVDAATMKEDHYSFISVGAL